MSPGLTLITICCAIILIIWIVAFFCEVVGNLKRKYEKKRRVVISKEKKYEIIEKIIKVPNAIVNLTFYGKNGEQETYNGALRETPEQFDFIINEEDFKLYNTPDSIVTQVQNLNAKRTNYLPDDKKYVAEFFSLGTVEVLKEYTDDIILKVRKELNE